MKDRQKRPCLDRGKISDFSLFTRSTLPLPLPPSLPFPVLSLPTSPAPVDFRQRRLLDHLNEYLTFKNRPLLSVKGYCYGLTMLWLLRMVQGRRADFYRDIKTLLDCSVLELCKIERTTDLFITLIDCGQNIKNYCSDHTWRNSDVILAFINAVEKGHNPASGLPIGGFKENFTLKTVTQCFDASSLALAIKAEMQEKTMMRINGDTSSTLHHAIGLYRRFDCYYLYDSNYFEGKPKEFHLTRLQELVAEIQFCLYTNLENTVIPPSMKIELGIHTVLPAPSYRVASIFSEYERSQLYVPLLPSLPLPPPPPPRPSRWYSSSAI